MELRDLLCGIVQADAIPRGDVSLVAQDSRRVQPGAVFVCIRGGTVDGHDFAQKALDAGALLIVTGRPLGLPNEVTVPDTHLAYAALCQRFFGDPAKKLSITAVTGTNGKTTVSSVLKQVLEAGGRKCGLIGTVRNEIGGMEIPARFTTPEAWDLAALMARMVGAGCTHLVMEASSQALAQGRLAGLRFALGVFTNLTQDHLDYHGDMEAYYAAKRALFSQCDAALINTDDPWGARLFDEVPCNDKKSVSVTNAAANFSAHSVELKSGGVRFGFLGGDELYPVLFHMPGEYSVYNAVAAGGAAIMLGLSGREAAAALSAVKGVPGRCEVLYDGKYTILRDFAHTGDGLRKLLAALRPFVKNRLVVVFGCAGERDPAKRPDMGAAAAEYGDIVYLTADNPRMEPVGDTMKDAAVPLTTCGKPFFQEPDRVAAIHAALAALEPGDVLALCGKGHEDYQAMDGYTVYLDERQLVEEWRALQAD